MNSRLPSGITNENDLDMFERYLKDEAHNTADSMVNRIKSYKGKLIKAESLISGRLFARCGILLEIGEDYIVIRPQKSCSDTIIKLDDIKYITVICDDYRKNGLC